MSSYARPPLSTVFEVFNPLTRSWKVLPPPPLDFNLIIRDHCSWGHKLVIFCQWEEGQGTYAFDTREEKWEEADFGLKHSTTGFAQFHDFLFGIELSMAVHVFQLNPNGSGNLTPCGEISELDCLFNPALLNSSSLITNVDDNGLVFFLHAGEELRTNQWCIRVALFQLSQIRGTPKFRVEIKSIWNHYLRKCQENDICSFLVSRKPLKNPFMQKVV